MNMGVQDSSRCGHDPGRSDHDSRLEILRHVALEPVATESLSCLVPQADGAPEQTKSIEEQPSAPEQTAVAAIPQQQKKKAMEAHQIGY